MNDEERSGRDKLWAMIKRHRFAMLTTSQEGDVMRSRPMTTIEQEGDGHLWFFAKADSAAADALTDHPQVCLSYADSDKQDFVSVSGKAWVVGDAAKKKALWNPMVQAWFPQGPESPDVVLLKVEPEHAEFWDSNSNKLVQLFSIARALSSGRPPRDLGEHREVPLTPRT